MKKHKLGDSMIINSIAPVPDGWTSRNIVNTGNKYTNEALWDIYKNIESTMFTNLGTNQGSIPSQEDTVVDRTLYDGYSILGFDTYNPPSHPTYTYMFHVFSLFNKNGHFCVLMYQPNPTEMKLTYRIYTSKEPMVNDDTDYLYLYDHLNELYDLNDFEYYDIVLQAYTTSSSSYQKYTMPRVDGTWFVSFGACGSPVSTWYGDDRNGTNQQFLDAPFGAKINFDTKSYSIVTMRNTVAPRSLASKVRSSDPWQAINNYAFDVNNTEYVKIRSRHEFEKYGKFDMLSQEFYCDLEVKVREFYTVGFPETPAFNYKTMYYLVSPESGSPIPYYYINGGNVTSLSTASMFVFNKTIVRIGQTLSGAYSTIRGTEIIQPNTNFKIEDQLDSLHTAYDNTDGKQILYGNDTFGYQNPFESAQVTNFFDRNKDNGFFYRTMMKDPYNPVCIKMACQEPNFDSSNYFEHSSFIVDGDGFRWVGNDPFLLEFRESLSSTDWSASSFLYLMDGYDYMKGGHICKALLLKATEGRDKTFNVPYGSHEFGAPLYCYGQDEEGFYWIDAGHFQSLIQPLMTRNQASTAARADIFKVSEDLSIIEGFYSPQLGSYNRLGYTMGMNNYITQNWLLRGNWCSHKGFERTRQKDTYTIPVIETGDESSYQYITKISPDLLD